MAHDPATGLTPFLCNMLKTPKDKLARADPEKLAAKYAIRADWARWYLEQSR